MTENRNINTVLLNGNWKFSLDPERRGIRDAWYLKELSDLVRLREQRTATGKDKGRKNRITEI